MDSPADMEALVTRNLANQGLPRVPGVLAFLHKGEAVKVTIDQSVYTGYFVTVHDGPRIARQFRARAGVYEWTAIAAQIVEIAESRLERRRPLSSAQGMKEHNRQIADELATMTGAGPSSRLQIEPSSAVRGRVRVKLDEVELDPMSVIQLYAVVAKALPPK
jgi:hypothetical protein